MLRTEVWLSPNRRIYAVASVILGIVTLGLAIFAFLGVWLPNYWLAAIAGALTIVSAWTCGILLYAMRRPRLAYGDDQLWVYLDPQDPVGVPIEIVECFFLGQGPSFLPPVQGKEQETQNIIVRLAESAVDWKHREVPDRFGHWCEGYITIRGAWCEPITRDRMQELNRRLAEVHRERKAKAKAQTEIERQGQATA